MNVNEILELAAAQVTEVEETVLVSQAKEYLAFTPGERRTSVVLVVDQDRFDNPDKLLLREWSVVNDDRLPENYLLSDDGVLVIYSPKPEPEPPAKPDVDKMLTEIWDSPIWSMVPPDKQDLKLTFATLADLMPKYIARGELSRIQESWAIMKAKLPEVLIQLVETAARENNVPLEGK
jgi:hypothetical protein